MNTVLEISSLQPAERRLLKFFDKSLEPIILIDSDEIVVYCNNAICELLKEVPENIIGKKFLPKSELYTILRQYQTDKLNLITDDDAFVSIPAITVVNSDNYYFQIDLELSYFAFNTSGMPYYFIRVDDSNSTLTKVKKLHSNCIYSKLIQEANTPIFILKDGLVVEYNKKAEELFECEADELVGVTLSGLSPRFQETGVLSNKLSKINQVNLDDGKKLFFEWEHISKKGNRFWVQVEVSPINVDKEKYEFVVMHDITTMIERRRLLLKISESVEYAMGSEFFSKIVNQIRDILKADIVLLGKFSDTNPNLIETLIINVDGGIAQNFNATIEDGVFADLVINGLCVVPEGVEYLYPNDAFLNQNNVTGLVGTLLNNSAGKPLGVILACYKKYQTNSTFYETVLRVFGFRIASEIERLGNVDEIGKSRNYLHALVNNSPLYLWNINREGKFVLSEGSGLQRMIDSPAKLLGRDFRHYYRKAPNLINAILESFEGKEQTITVLFNDQFYEVSVFPQYDSGKKVIGSYGFAFDVTERVIVQRRLTELSIAVENSPMGIIMTDPQLHITYINPYYESLTGYSIEEVRGHYPSVFSDEVADISKMHEMVEFIQKEGMFKGEFKNQKKNGEEFWGWTTISAIYSSDGKLTGYVGFQEDTTWRHRMESDLQIALTEAEESNRLKAAILTNLSHEFRTPMVGILGYLDVLKEEIEDEDQQEIIARIYRASSRLNATLTAILDYARAESSNLSLDNTEFNIADKLVTEAPTFYAQANSKNLGCDVIINCTNIFLNTDERVFTQIINHLVDNAIKFTDRGRIDISLDDLIEDDTVWAMITVKDTGIGIPEDRQNDIFEAFKQVSEGLGRSYEGSGLGLTLVHKMVAMLKGEIILKSEENVGTEITVKFPALIK